VLEIVSKILRLMNSNLEPQVLNEASNEIRHQYLSAEKARRILNWHPLFNLDQALSSTIDWYKEFFTHERTI
jgi:CDP-glucose 4,6-dehydratase